MLEPCLFCGALPCDWVNNPHTPPTGQSDEALVEELARGFCREWGQDTWSRYNVEQHTEFRRQARAILPILTAREAAAKAEGRREGIEAAGGKLASAIERMGEELCALSGRLQQVDFIHCDSDPEKDANAAAYEHVVTAWQKLCALAEKQP